MANKFYEQNLCDNNAESTIIKTSSSSDYTTPRKITTISSCHEQMPETFCTFDDTYSSDINTSPTSTTHKLAIDQNVDNSRGGYTSDCNGKSQSAPINSKSINGSGLRSMRTIARVSSCREQVSETIFSLDDTYSPDIQTPSASTIHNLTLCQNIGNLENITVATSTAVSNTRLLRKIDSCTLRPSVYRTRISLEGQEKIDFMYLLTICDNFLPVVEKIFSFLSFRDISSMIYVSKIWQNAVLNSRIAQKEMEYNFIQAILYFCHDNINVTEEYEYLYRNILLDFKKHVDF